METPPKKGKGSLLFFPGLLPPTTRPHPPMAQETESQGNKCHASPAPSLSHLKRLLPSCHAGSIVPSCVAT